MSSDLLRLLGTLNNAGRQADSELIAEFGRGAANLMRGAFVLSALKAQRSLEEAFPSEPIREEWPELRAARCSMYLIGSAVERSMLEPVWECPPQYRRVFHIRRLSFTLNATALEGRVLSWDDFGGLERYLALLEYCASSANAAYSNGASRTLPRFAPSTSTEFGGVIGSPATASEDPSPAAGVRPPRGFPGEQPVRRLAPDAPPFLPPQAPEDPDSWDNLFEEQAGQWHVKPPDRSLSPSYVLPQPSPLATSSPLGAPVGNLVGRFVDEKCETGDNKRMLAGELYEGFLGWCQDWNQQPVSQRAFGLRLSGMGFRRKRRGHGKHWWEGLALAEVTA